MSDVIPFRAYIYCIAVFSALLISCRPTAYSTRDRLELSKGARKHAGVQVATFACGGPGECSGAAIPPASEITSPRKVVCRYLHAIRTAFKPHCSYKQDKTCCDYSDGIKTQMKSHHAGFDSCSEIWRHGLYKGCYQCTAVQPECVNCAASVRGSHNRGAWPSFWFRTLTILKMTCC